MKKNEFSKTVSAWLKEADDEEELKDTIVDWLENADTFEIEQMAEYVAHELFVDETDEESEE